MNKLILLTGAMLSVVAASAAPATNAADEIVVTASRAGRAAAEMPQNVSIITARDIEKSGAANVVDAVKNIGGVEFRSTSGNSAQAEIALRGFGVDQGVRRLYRRGLTNRRQRLIERRQVARIDKRRFAALR
jgi:outer membrane cobalamin receptor